MKNPTQLYAHIPEFQLNAQPDALLLEMMAHLMKQIDAIQSVNASEQK